MESDEGNDATMRCGEGIKRSKGGVVVSVARCRGPSFFWLKGAPI